MNHEKLSTKSTYTRRRLIAGGALAATVFGVSQVGLEIKRNVDLLRASDTYSQPNLAAHYLNDPKINPREVVVGEVLPGDETPIAVANRMGARDPAFVGGEIAGQVGGSHAMNIGEKIVIPFDQLQK